MRFDTAVILAGGKSKRMGFDKQTITINGVRLIERIVETLKTEFREVIVVTDRFDLYNERQFLLVKDVIPDKGPLGGIYSGLLNSTSDYVYVTACDMPFLNIEYIQYMDKILKGNDSFQACVARKGKWIEPLNAFFKKDIVLALGEYLQKDRTSIHAFLENVNCFYLEEAIVKEFSPDWSMFFSINTLEDMNTFDGFEESILYAR